MIIRPCELEKLHIYNIRYHSYIQWCHFSDFVFGCVYKQLYKILMCDFNIWEKVSEIFVYFFLLDNSN